MLYCSRLIFSMFFLFLACFFYSSISYSELYLLGIGFIVFQTKSNNINNMVMTLFLGLYFFIGLLNISTLRGSIDNETLFVVIFYLFFILLPTWFVSVSVKSYEPKDYFLNSFGYFFIICHILSAYLALTYVYLSIGNVFINQELRFYMPVWSGYVIRSVLVIPIVISIIQNEKGTYYIGSRNISILCYTPCFLIGSRGTLITFLLTHVLCLYLCNKSLVHNKFSKVYNLTKTKMTMISMVVLFVIVSGFYLRRINSDIFASPEELVSYYFDYDSFWIYIIMPFYFAFRETIGITNAIIMNGITNPLPIPLYFSDLFTLLPGDYKAAGQLLGDTIGRVGDGGLTPGIIGGLYIDFSYFGVLLVLCISLPLSLLYKYSYVNKKSAALFSLIMFQFIHLIHRGFLKPEYITFLILCCFYLKFVNVRKA